MSEIIFNNGVYETKDERERKVLDALCETDAPIKLTERQTDFIKSMGSFNDYNGNKYFLPFVFIENNDGTFNVESICNLKRKDLLEFQIDTFFTLEEMKDCGLAMANWGEGVEGTLTPREYFKEKFDIDI